MARRLGAVLACAWVVLAAAQARAEQQDTLQKVLRSGVLVAGVAEDDPPFGFRDPDSGSLDGYDVDTMRAIADRLGVRLKLRPVTPANRIAALVEGRVDVLATALTHTDARDAVMDFTDHYLVSGQKLIARRGSIRRFEDLEGKKIGAVVGTFSEVCARDRCKLSTVVTFEDYMEGIEALLDGRIDAFTAQEAILADLLSYLPRQSFEIPEVTILQEEYHLGVRKGDKALLDALNRALAEIRSSGEAQRIRDRWFGRPEEVAPPAYGAIVRRAATRPKFLGILLNGFLYPEAEVSVYSLDGRLLGRGYVTRVIEDEFYVDVDPAIYGLVRPGFLVAMNMTRDMVLDALTRGRETLKGVAATARKEAERIQQEAYKEALERERRAREMDTLRERTRISIQADRARYFHGYGRYRHLH